MSRNLLKVFHNFNQLLSIVLECSGISLLIAVGLNAQDGDTGLMKGPPAEFNMNSAETYGSGKNFLLDIYQDYISPVK